MGSRTRLISLSLLAAGASAAIVRLDGWRPAVVAGAAALAVLGTRIRFAPWLAAGVLTVVGGLAVGHAGIAGDTRPGLAQRPPSATHHGAHRHHRKAKAARAKAQRKTKNEKK
jgi:hypothetical protein